MRRDARNETRREKRDEIVNGRKLTVLLYEASRMPGQNRRNKWIPNRYKITFKSTAVHERICDETSQNHIANFMLVYMFVLAVRLTETSP